MPRWFFARSDDGMPAYSQGIKPLIEAPTPIVSMVIRTFDIGEGVAASHQELRVGHPPGLFLHWGGDERGHHFALPSQNFANCVPVGAPASMRLVSDPAPPASVNLLRDNI